MTKKALGKGLETLLPDMDSSPVPEGPLLQEIDIEKIRPSRYQPREVFSNKELEELAESIRANGLIQPVLVRPLNSGIYELIAGERRWRAARIAGLKSIRAMVREVTAEKSLEIALIENLQRENLNPLEAAKGYDRLIKEFSFTQEDVAKRVGKDRSTISNYLRLLTLPERIQEYLARSLLFPGHAKAILSVKGEKEQVSFADFLVKKRASVRESEEWAKKWGVRAKKKKVISEDYVIKDIEMRLQRIFGTKVRIQGEKERGKIIVEYYDLENLNRILEIMGAV